MPTWETASDWDNVQSESGDDPLIGYYDGGDYPKPANGADFVVTWPSEGLYNLTN